jgi:hypothetical protein
MIVAYNDYFLLLILARRSIDRDRAPCRRFPYRYRAINYGVFDIGDLANNTIKLLLSIIMIHLTIKNNIQF